MSENKITRYPGESAVDFANRRLKAQGKTHIKWFLVNGHMVLRDVVDKQGRLNV